MLRYKQTLEAQEQARKEGLEKGIRFFVAFGVQSTWKKLYILDKSGTLYSEFLYYWEPSLDIKQVNFETFKAEDYSFKGYQNLTEITYEQAVKVKLKKQENWIDRYLEIDDNLITDRDHKFYVASYYEVALNRFYKQALIINEECDILIVDGNDKKSEDWDLEQDFETFDPYKFDRSFLENRKIDFAQVTRKTLESKFFLIGSKIDKFIKQ